MIKCTTKKHEGHSKHWCIFSATHFLHILSPLGQARTSHETVVAVRTIGCLAGCVPAFKAVGRKVLGFDSPQRLSSVKDISMTVNLKPATSPPRALWHLFQCMKVKCQKRKQFVLSLCNAWACKAVMLQKLAHPSTSLNAHQEGKTHVSEHFQ